MCVNIFIQETNQFNIHRFSLNVEMKAVIALTTAVLRIFEGHVICFQPILRRKGIDECLVYQMLASVHYICPLLTLSC